MASGGSGEGGRKVSELRSDWEAEACPTLDRSEGCLTAICDAKSGRWWGFWSRSNSAAVPVQSGVRRRRVRTASTKGCDGGGGSKASRMSRALQFRAGAAAWAQARAAVWRVPDKVVCGGQARAWLTAVQRAPRILGKAAWMMLPISCSERRAASGRGGRGTIRSEERRVGKE